MRTLSQDASRVDVGLAVPLDRQARKARALSLIVMSWLPACAGGLPAEEGPGGEPGRRESRGPSITAG